MFTGSSTTSKEDKSHRGSKFWWRTVSQVEVVQTRSRSYSGSLRGLFCVSSQSGWPTGRNTHFLFHKMSGLLVSEFFCQVSLSIGETYQREQTSILCCRERESGSPLGVRQPVRTTDTTLAFSCSDMEKAHQGALCRHIPAVAARLALSSLADAHASSRPSLPLHLKT